ncbi:MAG: hypothetical protein V3U65_10640 [Granulosicoccaceae bacterium]
MTNHLRNLVALVITVVMSSISIAQTVEESAEACSEAARLIKEDKLDDALDEANWCLEGLKQLKQSKTLAVLPDEVNGFVGSEVSSNSLLGMTTMERTYQQGDTSVLVSMMSVEGDGGGFAAIAAMGMSLGSAGKKYRVQKRTVVDNSTASGKAEYIVQMKSGGMINVSSKTLGSETVLDFIRAFPIKDIDEALGR